MMSQERDTHFQNFAKMLYEDFLQLQREDESSMKEFLAADYPNKWRMKVEQLIAQRAYDLAVYVTDHTRGAISRDPKFVIRHNVPDMDKWPE